MTKRAVDVVLAGILLAVCWPVLLLVALAVRLSSPGTVFFRQERVGRGGTRFRIHKFRTMRIDLPGPDITAASDARVTRVGRMLRSTKLDEVPQLLDVLAGDMSLVGPRPELPRYVALWPAPARDVVLSVRPGITDPAAVAFRREAEELARVPDSEQYYVSVVTPRKLEMYVDYVRNRSLAGDLRVMARTITAIVAH